VGSLRRFVLEGGFYGGLLFGRLGCRDMGIGVLVKVERAVEAGLDGQVMEKVQTLLPMIDNGQRKMLLLNEYIL